jgi:predicted XRE-type DNA-binding protein
MTRKNPHVGSSFDEFLAEEGILGECEAQAIKEVLALQVDQAMKERGLNKSNMAQRMHTSRSQLDRLLDPQHTSVKLSTLQRAATTLGKHIRLELVDAPGGRATRTPRKKVRRAVPRGTRRAGNNENLRQEGKLAPAKVR